MEPLSAVSLSASSEKVVRDGGPTNQGLGIRPDALLVPISSGVLTNDARIPNASEININGRCGRDEQVS